MLSDGESRAKYNLVEPIPLQVEHVAVEFIVEPFRPFGPFILLFDLVFIQYMCVCTKRLSSLKARRVQRDCGWSDSHHSMKPTIAIRTARVSPFYYFCLVLLLL